MNLITAAELARELRVSLRTIRRMVKAKRIPIVRIGTAQRFELATVKAALKGWL